MIDLSITFPSQARSECAHWQPKAGGGGVRSELKWDTRTPASDEQFPPIAPECFWAPTHHRRCFEKHQLPRKSDTKSICTPPLPPETIIDPREEAQSRYEEETACVWARNPSRGPGLRMLSSKNGGKPQSIMYKITPMDQTAMRMRMATLGWRT